MRHDVSVVPLARVTVPVDADRSPATTVPLAAAIARQCATEVEFVAVAGTGEVHSTEVRLRTCCEWALHEGAPKASWSVLGSGDGAGTAADAAGRVGGYATWSGSGVLCFSTGRHRHGLGRAGRALVRHAAVPILVFGPHAVVSRPGYRRLVVGLDGAHPRAEIVAAAVEITGRMNIELFFTQVVPPSPPGVHAYGSNWVPRGDVQESAYLHRVAEMAHCPHTSFDTLHAAHPAEGIVRYIGRDEATITMVGAPTAARHGWRRAGPVVRSVLRRSVGPVLLVPTRATA
jgi:nucleotide-binding universal stress UspA family protein